MNSYRNKAFRDLFAALPLDVRTSAEEAYLLWSKDPFHHSLQFKKIHSRDSVYSVRIGLHWRAIGTRRGDEIVWFWIGSHAAYDVILRRL